MTTLSIKDKRILGAWVSLVLILFLGGVVWSSQPGDTEYTAKLKIRILENPADLVSRYELADIFYNLSGFKEFLVEQSLLWTETEFCRNDLMKKLPRISFDSSKEYQAQLFQINALRSGNARNDGTKDAEAFVMSGDYHLSLGQKDIAFWHYGEAVRIAPDFSMALLALADFYLFERQSDRVLKLLAGLEGPEIDLRRGEAYLQEGEFQYALGYLLQSDPLPEKWQLTRDKDLMKVYIKLGDKNRAGEIAKQCALNTSSAIYTSIYQELSSLLTKMKDNTAAKSSSHKAEEAFVTDNGFLIKLPVPGKLVAVVYNEAHDAASYIEDQFLTEHLIPGEVINERLHGGNGELNVWYKGEDGLWQRFNALLALPESSIVESLHVKISCDNIRTNTRTVRIRMTVEDKPQDLIEMSIGEVGETITWIPFNKFYNCQLSDGDGEKKILARFRDRYGNFGESELLLMLDITPPKLKSMDTRESDGDYLNLTWMAGEKVKSWVRLLSRQGSWEEILIPAGTDGLFRFSFPEKTNLFCQIVLKDDAGNQSVFPVSEANRELANDSEIRFIVSRKLDSSIRMVEIKPEFADGESAGDNPAFYWAISNDLTVWSDWRQGMDAVKWRLKPGEGEKLVYVKYRVMDELNAVKYQVVSIEPGYLENAI